jgi:hypothetical protein
MTLRLSPRDGEEQRLQAALRAIVEELPTRAGFGGAHLLRTDTPAIATTTEQKIRGNADRSADWVFIVCAYEFETLKVWSDEALAPVALEALGAAPGAVASCYSLSLSMARAENAPSR